MPPEVCRAVFAARLAACRPRRGRGDARPAPAAPRAGARSTGPAGSGRSPRRSTCRRSPSSPARGGATSTCPTSREGIDAILLDELADPADFERLRHLVGLLARKPVVGAVETLPEVRRALAAVAPQERRRAT